MFLACTIAPHAFRKDNTIKICFRIVKKIREGWDCYRTRKNKNDFEKSNRAGDVEDQSSNQKFMK